LKNKLSNKYENENKRFTLSHITQYVFLSMYIFVVIFGVMKIAELFRLQQYSLGVQLIIALFSFVGISATVSVGFYFNKSQKENDRKISNAKYDKRLNMAIKISDLLKENKLSANAVSLLKSLISDNETSVNVDRFGGVTTIDETKYSASNLASNLSSIGSEIISNNEDYVPFDSIIKNFDESDGSM